jgi:hypothetical protein
MKTGEGRFSVPSHARFGVIGEIHVGTADMMAEERRKKHRSSKYEGGWCKDCKSRADGCECSVESWSGECRGPS